MANIYWLEQTEADVPEGNGWLSAGEAVCLSGMRFAKRRSDWRLGRWTAKRALASYLELPADADVFTRIEVRAASCGAPEVFVAAKPAALTISLSHRDHRAACAVAPAGVELGCDLELIEPRSDAFVSDYFTVEEQALVSQTRAADRPRVVALLWSAKESALKALRTGLRMDTRCVMVTQLGEFNVDGWSPLQVHCAGHAFPGWWQHADRTVRTMVADPFSPAPIRLTDTGCFPGRIRRCA